MKKTRFLTLFLCLVMILCVLCACQADPDGEKTPNNPPVNNNGGDNPNDASNSGGEEEPKPEENKLYRKTIIWNGDSICYGSSRYGNWATRIAERNELKDSKNYGVGGATIVENPPPFQSGSERHSVSATLEEMYEEFPDADYIILEGGTNDADLLGRITEEPLPYRFGSVDPDDFSGNYDTYTFCGALESIFYRAKELWPKATICYIVAQKMGLKADTSANRYAYFQAAMQICEKWEIPYLNLWDDCDLDPTNPEMYDPSKSEEENEQSSMYKDGQHLTPAGYDYTTDIIDGWLKTLQ